MSTKARPSWFILVRVRKAGGMGFTLPIPLALFGEVLEALSDLARLAEAVSLGCSRRSAGVSASGALDFCRSVVSAVRRYGQWRMVEVDTDGYSVAVDFF